MAGRKSSLNVDRGIQAESSGALDVEAADELKPPASGITVDVPVGMVSVVVLVKVEVPVDSVVVVVAVLVTVEVPVDKVVVVILVVV